MGVKLKSKLSVPSTPKDHKQIDQKPKIKMLNTTKLRSQISRKIIPRRRDSDEIDSFPPVCLVCLTNGFPCIFLPKDYRRPNQNVRFDPRNLRNDQTVPKIKHYHLLTRASNEHLEEY